jgi:hypothetical protein
VAQGAAIAAPARLRVKVCCVQAIAEARLALASGADALDLVGRMPSGPGPIRLRPNGPLDPGRLAAFVRAARG